MATAISPTTVSRPSCWRCGRSADSACSPKPTPRQISAASPTPEPDQPQQILAPTLLQERSHDADDEGGFEPLAQADDERGEHAGTFG